MITISQSRLLYGVSGIVLLVSCLVSLVTYQYAMTSQAQQDAAYSLSEAWDLGVKFAEVPQDDGVHIEKRKCRGSSAVPVAKAPDFKSTVFVGHENCDTDSIISAIGAAHLFEGYAASCEKGVNAESAYILNTFNVPVPPKTSDPQFVDANWGLVDTSELAQLPVGVVREKIKIIIDHHGIGEQSVFTDVPIYVDMRPWGSCATIIAYKYWEQAEVMPEVVAKLLMAGTLSDTLNLRSPTTTNADRYAVEHLAKITKMSKQQVTDFVYGMFQAKSDTGDMSPSQIISIDYKEYQIGNFKVGWGTGETVDASIYESQAPAFMTALQQKKQERGLDYIFFSAVDLMKVESVVFLCSPDEVALAQKVWMDGTMVAEGVMDLGARVSRKKQFVPPLLQELTP